MQWHAPYGLPATIDPETGQLRTTSVWAPLLGGTMRSSSPVTIDTEWTDQLPAE